MYELIDVDIDRSRRLASDVAFFTSDHHPYHQEGLSVRTAFKINRKLDDYLGVFSVALCDIDHFKQVNDQYGHLEGDNVLRTLGSLLSDKTIFRSTDISGRYGGEEFLLLFPDTSMRNARVPLEKLMTAVRNLRFRIGQEKTITITITITISIGVAELNPKDSNIDSIIKRADDAFYKAKQTGRDKIVFCPEIIKN
jgi:diguanylate cyclase (GGDEF)-like protein